MLRPQAMTVPETRSTLQVAYFATQTLVREAGISQTPCRLFLSMNKKPRGSDVSCERISKKIRRSDEAPLMARLIGQLPDKTSVRNL